MKERYQFPVNITLSRDYGGCNSLSTELRCAMLNDVVMDILPQNLNYFSA